MGGGEFSLTSSGTFPFFGNQFLDLLLFVNCESCLPHLILVKVVSLTSIFEDLKICCFENVLEAIRKFVT